MPPFAMKTRRRRTACVRGTLGGFKARRSCRLKAIRDQPSASSHLWGRNTFGGFNAVPSCGLKGCATAAVGPLPADPRSLHNPPHSTLAWSAKPHVAHAMQKRRPLQGRSVGGRRDPGATLRLPPATSEQAFSLQSPRCSGTVIRPSVVWPCLQMTHVMPVYPFSLRNSCVSSGTIANKSATQP